MRAGRLAILALLSTAFLLLSVPLLAAAATVPPSPENYWLDPQGVLSSATQDLIDKASKALDERTGAQVVVAVVDDLGGRAIEDYALDILRTWGVGDAAKDNGILLLVAMADRKTRIEVGYGLEGRINDAKAGRILDEQLLPQFREGNYDAGVRNAYLSILSEVAAEYGLDPDALTGGTATTPVPDDGTKDSSVGNVLLVILVIVVLLVDWIFLRGAITRAVLLSFFLRGGGRGGFRGGGGSGGGGFRGGGGSGGGGGASRGW